MLDIETLCARTAAAIVNACGATAHHHGEEAARAKINFTKAPAKFARMAKAGGYVLGRFTSPSPELDEQLPVGWLLIESGRFAEFIEAVKARREAFLADLTDHMQHWQTVDDGDEYEDDDDTIDLDEGAP